MANKIPIDDLFRDILSEGKEQLNLGAWANMNRMLDGQNPYAADENEPKKKRRILPFLAIFLLLTTAISAGYIWLSHNNERKDKLSHNLVLSQDNTDDSMKPSTEKSNQDPNELNTTQTPLNQINNTANSGKQTSQKAIKQNNKNNNEVSYQKLSKRELRKIRNNNELNYRDAIPTPESGGQRKDIDQNAGHNLTKDVNAELPKAKAGDENPLAVKDPKRKNRPGLANKKDQKQNAGEVAVVEIPEAPQKSTKFNQITAVESRVKNRNGTIRDTRYDTIGFASREIFTDAPQPEPALKEEVRDANYKYHPRYLGADIQAVEHPVATNALPPASEKKSENTPTLSAKSESSKSNTKKEKNDIFKNLGNFAGNSVQKVGEQGSNFLRMFSVLDPGISLGVNAALFNTVHNYGGFHAGLTNRTAISNMFNIITELKFFIRNNSGFTANDIKTTILNKYIDTTVPNQTTYHYQIDSLTKKYNFKSFMSLELPVLLNAKFGNLSVYGGPNFVYNFKLKIQEIDRKYVLTRQDVVNNGTQYNYPEEKGMQYVRSDFGSRFGIGYAVGLSYNFNPKIYLDLRLSKVMWDNTKTNSAREISNGVSKVPFTQLSIGYRFLNKDKD